MNYTQNLSNSYVRAGLVAINLGYCNTKIVYRNNNKTQLTCFSSRVSKHVDEDEFFLYKGEKYSIGSGSNDLSMNKVSSIHQDILLKYSLSKIPCGKKKVVVALPCDSYINKSSREDYKTFILENPDVEDCLVYMEGAAAIFSDLPFFENRYVILLDIGGLTINAMIVDNCKIEKGSPFSMQLGAFILKNRIKKALEQSNLNRVRESQIKYLLTSPCVKTVIFDYVNEIKNELAKMQFPTGVEIYCVGGGALDFKQVFIENFNAKISPNPIYANALGMYAIGRRYWEGV